ncbi:MAG: sce7726 family protein [Clostridia bacterium]|nr:sce7726 family protein [Clostridia bacterium]
MLDKSIKTLYPKIQSITFEEAANMFAAYSTLSSNQKLTEILFEKYGFQCDSKDARSIINYTTISKYPNETTIKSAFINNVLSKTKNHITIFELNTNNCRVDLCKINGESVAFEIKTDLDNLKRLNNQLTDYLDVFEEVYVICSEDKYVSILEAIPECVGIYTYKVNRLGNYIFTKTKPASQKHNICHTKQLELISKRDKIRYSININSHPSKVNFVFKQTLKEKYSKQWNFLISNKDSIFDIDYQWFFKNQIEPSVIYNY